MLLHSDKCMLRCFIWWLTFDKLLLLYGPNVVNRFLGFIFRDHWRHWITRTATIPRHLFLDLNLRISNGTVSTKIYNKRDDFDFDIVNFPFLDGDVPRRTSYGVYISQLIRFARASSNLNDFNYRNKALTAKLLRQGYLYFKFRKAFSKFYRRHSALLEKYSVSLKTLLQQGISELEFYGDLVYRFRKIVGKSNFSEQFRKLINRYKRIGYSLDIMRQTACLVVNPIIVDGYASLFNCTMAVRASDPMTASS